MSAAPKSAPKMPLTAYTGADIFDGETRHRGAALLVRGAHIKAITPADRLPETARPVALAGGILAPGFVDLQVNGGGGVMFNDAQTPETLARIADAHAARGTLSLLPTLISDTPARVSAAINAARQAIAAGVAGIIGLHLEGPHLSLARKGAHDPAMIRPMQDRDLDELLHAARDLPSLMVTVAPETVTPAQIEALSQAGIIVSLGHSDADYELACTAAAHGARCVTHLFNAMSQLSNRAPGLVGAALSGGGLYAGLIADAIHVHPAAIRTALHAKSGPGEIFLVTDAMATAGTELRDFTLNGRRIYRRDGRLTLGDGTLAGADLDMPRALQVMVQEVGVSPDRALAMATSIPARLLGRSDRIGRLSPGMTADFVHLSPDFTLQSVWRAGQPPERPASPPIAP